MQEADRVHSIDRLLEHQTARRLIDAGMRLRWTPLRLGGVGYQIVTSGGQVLAGLGRDEQPLTLAEVIAFARRAGVL